MHADHRRERTGARRPEYDTLEHAVALRNFDRLGGDGRRRGGRNRGERRRGDSRRKACRDRYRDDDGQSVSHATRG